MEAMERYRPQESEQEQRRRHAAENAFFRLDARRALRMHRKLAMYSAAAIFAVLLLAAVASHTYYSAGCTVSVEPSTQQVMVEAFSPQYGTDALSFDALMEQQVQLARRYDVLARAIATPGTTWRGKKESEQSAVERLARGMTVQRVGKSYQLSIAVTTKDPAQSALLANAVTQNFLAASRAGQLQDNQDRLHAVRGERAALQTNLDQKIAQQSALLQRLHIAPGANTPLDSNYANLSSAAAAAQVKHDEALAHLHSLDLPSAEAAMPAETSQFGPNTLQEKRNTLVAQMAGLTPNHPVYKADREALAEIDREIVASAGRTRQAAMARAQSQARADLAAATALQATLNGQLAAEAAKVVKNTPELEQSNQLATDIARMEIRYTAVDDRIRNLELENSNVGQLQLTQAARPPLQPNPNKRALLLTMLFPASLFGGLLAALLALRLDPRIYSPGDVEAVLGYSPFSLLLHRKEASLEVMEEYLLRMAAGVESLYATRGVKTLLVTGTSAETGASSIATALALKLQQMNRDSALLDAEAEDAAITQEDVRGLADQHGFLIVDAPPLLSSARAEYLARFTDAVVLVVEAGRTTRAELRRAVRLLEKVNAHGLAVVLNKVSLVSAEDAVQREVAELEQRILERGTSGYNKPALRVYNTQQQEHVFDAIAEPEEIVEESTHPAFPDFDAVRSFLEEEPALAAAHEVAELEEVAVAVAEPSWHESVLSGPDAHAAAEQEFPAPVALESAKPKGPRRLFQFPWSTTREEIEESRPRNPGFDKPVVGETPEVLQPEKKAPRGKIRTMGTTEWMDRGEIERLLLGSGTRKR